MVNILEKVRNNLHETKGQPINDPEALVVLEQKRKAERDQDQRVVSAMTKFALDNSVMPRDTSEHIHSTGEVPKVEVDIPEDSN